MEVGGGEEAQQYTESSRAGVLNANEYGTETTGRHVNARRGHTGRLTCTGNVQAKVFTRREVEEVTLLKSPYSS